MTTTTPAPGSPTWMRPLGSTGLQVSAVCAGGSPLGSMPRLYGRDVSANEGIATAHAVLQSPIRFIDTSNGYSDGENERRIGKAIAASGGLPDGFVVATRSTRAAATTPETGSVRRSPRAGSVFAWTTCRWCTFTIPRTSTSTRSLHRAVPSMRSSGSRSRVRSARSASPAAASMRWRSAYSTGCWSTTVGRSWTAAREPSSSRPFTAAWGSSTPRCTEAASWRGRAAGRPPTATGWRRRRSSRQPPRCAAHGADLTTAALQFSLRDARLSSTVVGMSRPERVEDTVAAASRPVPEVLWGQIESLLPPERVWLDAPLKR